MQSNISIDFKLKCIIGILEFERIEKQQINVKAKISSNSFLDYAKVMKKIKKILKKYKFKTLEKACKTIIKKLKKSFKQITKIKLEILKTEIVKNAILGVKCKKKY